MHDDTIEIIYLNDDESADYRVRVVPDCDADPPYDETGVPVFELRESRLTGQLTTEGHVYGLNRPHVREMAEAFDYFSDRFGLDALDVFDRYLRVYHEGWADTLSSRSHYGPQYLAFITREIADEWGAKVTPPPGYYLSDFQAYLDGECYAILVEERQTETVTRVTPTRTLPPEARETWVAGASLCGCYGPLDGWVREVARDLLAEASS